MTSIPASIRYHVVTPTGLSVFSSDYKHACVCYISQAISKGSVPGFLTIVIE